MSNSRNAYGWIGHIISAEDEWTSSIDHNVIAVKDTIFKSLFEAFSNCELDERIHVEHIGIRDCETPLLACGVCFSRGYTNYGTIFVEAEVRIAGEPYSNPEIEYLKAMKEIYELNLPKCQFMIGCASDY